MGSGKKQNAVPHRGRVTRKRRRKRRRLRVGLALLVALACIVSGALALSTLFRVSEFTVEGDLGSYTAEQVIEASGIAQQTDLFRVDRAAAAARIEAALPYVQQAQVRLRAPNGIRIHVTSAQPAAVLKTDSDTVLLTAEGKVLGAADGSEQLPSVVNAQVTAAQPGRPAEYARPETARILQELLEQLAAQQLTEIQTIDLTDLYSVSLRYGSLYVIKIGNTSDFAQKIKFAQYLIENKLEPGQPGTIDLSVSIDEAIFRPDYGVDHVIIAPDAAASSGTASAYGE